MVPLTNEYWKYVCNELETPEGIGAWDVVDNEDDINVIRLKWYFILM